MLNPTSLFLAKRALQRMEEALADLQEASRNLAKAGIPFGDLDNAIETIEDEIMHLSINIDREKGEL